MVLLLLLYMQPLITEGEKSELPQGGSFRERMRFYINVQHILTISECNGNVDNKNGAPKSSAALKNVSVLNDLSANV